MEKFTESLQSILPDEAKGIDGRGCAPMFVIIKNGQCQVRHKWCCNFAPQKLAARNAIDTRDNELTVSVANCAC